MKQIKKILAWAVLILFLTASFCAIIIRIYNEGISYVIYLALVVICCAIVSICIQAIND